MPTRVDRRTLLRGLGSFAIALPFLEAMGCSKQPEAVGSTRSALTKPRRFVALSYPNGTVVDQWFPSGEESSFTLGPIAKPYEPHVKDLLFFRGVDMTCTTVGPHNGHHERVTAMLTGRAPIGADTASAEFAPPAGISLDQAIAKLVSADTRVGSLILGTENYGDSMSASGANQWMRSERNPKNVFAQLFGDGSADAAKLARIAAERKSVLDGVAADFAALSKRISAKDRARVDQHLTAVRDVETRLSRAGVACAPGPNTYSTFKEYGAATQQMTREMLDLIVLAFACDLTRVAALAQHHEGAGGSLLFKFLSPPITDEHHELSHQGPSNTTARATLTRLLTWFSEQNVYLIERLKATPGEDGRSLFESTMILEGTTSGDGPAHDHKDIPWVLADGTGTFRTGRYLQYARRPHNDLLLSIARAYGSAESSFGDPKFCTGPLPNMV